MREPARFSGLLVELPAKAVKAPLTALACAVCIAVFAGLWLTGDPEAWEQLARWGAPSSDAIWDGRYWALLTSCFVHADPVHLAFNVYWLWTLGRALERELRWAEYLALLISAGIVSSASQLAASGDTGIGISGVVYALFGFLWCAPSRYPRFAEVLDRRTAGWLLLWLVGCFVATQAGLLNIANAAHVSGVLFGAGIGVAAARPVQRRAALAGTVLLSVWSIGLAFWCPWNPGWTMWRGTAAFLRGEHAAAEQWYRRSLAQGEDPAWVWSHLGHLALVNQDEEGYLAALEVLRESDSENAEWLVDLRRERRGLRFALASTRNPIERDILTADLAVLDWNARLAEDSYRKIAAESPQYPRALSSLANFLLFQKDALSKADKREALTLAQSAVYFTHREDTEILDTLAEAWFQNGKPCEAVAVADEWQVLLRKRESEPPSGFQERYMKYLAACGR